MFLTIKRNEKKILLIQIEFFFLTRKTSLILFDGRYALQALVWLKHFQIYSNTSWLFFCCRSDSGKPQTTIKGENPKTSLDSKLRCSEKGTNFEILSQEIGTICQFKDWYYFKKRKLQFVIYYRKHVGNLDKIISRECIKIIISYS